MRQIGTLPTEEQASRFIGYLFTLGIEAKGEQDGTEIAIWAFDENRLDEAHKELVSFQQDPQAEKYQNLDQQISTLISQQSEKIKAAQRNKVSVRERWDRPAWQSTPVTISLIAISVAVVLIASSFESFMNLCDKKEPVVNLLMIEPVRDSVQEGYITWKSGLPKISHGEVWRLFTPMFLHFSALHILFNMMWLKDLGKIIEIRQGHWRFLLMVLVIALLSNLGQYVMSGPNFGGMSGVVYGLFGYIWMKSKFEPETGFFMPPNIVFMMIGWFFLCLIGVIGNVANTAHGVGLVVGMMFGGFRPALRSLFRPESHR